MPKLGATLSRVGGASVALVAAAAAEADGATAVDAEGVPVLDGSALSAPQRRRSLGSPPRLQFARALSGDAMPTRKPPLPMSPDSLCASPESADESAKPAARCGAPSPCEASSQGEAPAPLRSGAWLIGSEECGVSCVFNPGLTLHCQTSVGNNKKRATVKHATHNGPLSRQ